MSNTLLSFFMLYTLCIFAGLLDNILHQFLFFLETQYAFIQNKKFPRTVRRKKEK